MLTSSYLLQPLALAVTSVQAGICRHDVELGVVASKGFVRVTVLFLGGYGCMQYLAHFCCCVFPVRLMLGSSR